MNKRNLLEWLDEVVPCEFRKKPIEERIGMIYCEKKGFDIPAMFCLGCNERKKK